MNVAGYGQSLREMGSRNLEALADIERERQKLGWAQKARRPINYGLEGVPDRLEFKPYTPWQHMDDLVDHFRNLSFL